MKRACANISIFELTKIADQCELIVQAFSSQPRSSDKVYASQEVSGKSLDILKSVVNVENLNTNTLCPPFILAFEIFNYNVHNCLIDSSASTNVMPLSVAKKINAKWDKTDAQIIQLNKSLVQTIGELNNVISHLSSNHRVHQCINIVIVDITKACVLLLSSDWSCNLQGYFSTY